MPYLTTLADILRRAGLSVREIPGWQTRGHGAFGEVLGVLAHHTAGPASGDYPSEAIVVNGRPGLAGPLANLGLTRSGTWVVIAAGQAWHAGTGSVPWCPANQGNAHLIGVEAESVGTRDDWTPAQREAYPRGVAALLRHLGLPAARAIGHKEWAPTRKIDPAFWGMAAFRADVARWMEDGDMPLTPDDLNKIRDAVWQAPIDDPIGKRPMRAFEQLMWACAHAAYSRGAAEHTAGALDGLADTLAARLAPALGQGGAPTVTDLAELIRAALAEVGPLHLTTYDLEVTP